MDKNTPTPSPQAAAETPNTPPAPPAERLAKGLYDLFEMFVLSIIAVMLLFTCGIRQCVVRGDSMERTLSDTQRLMVIDIGYVPQQGDIIVFHQTDYISNRFNEPIVKRVIATEGQWVDIDRSTKTVTVYDEHRENPHILDESAYAYFDSGTWDARLRTTFPVQVPENCVFVLGDNRNNSSDSSTEPVIGFVDVRRILGQAVVRIFPFSEAGQIG